MPEIRQDPTTREWVIIATERAKRPHEFASLSSAADQASRSCVFCQEDELVDVLLTYRERYLALKADPRVKLVLIFKNYGERAGSSIAHPHSQVIATPIIPGHIRRKNPYI
jgi:galactose-1-phosphate uridylyltransferase